MSSDPPGIGRCRTAISVVSNGNDELDYRLYRRNVPDTRTVVCLPRRFLSFALNNQYSRRGSEGWKK